MTTAHIRTGRLATCTTQQREIRGATDTGLSVVPHGLMFHHFHGPGLAPSQGSISGDTLARIIDRYRDSHNLLDAADYLQRARNNQLEACDTCLTFDDSLLCQYQVALPVLQHYNLRGFWFVYSSVITGNIEQQVLQIRIKWARIRSGLKTGVVSSKSSKTGGLTGRAERGTQPSCGLQPAEDHPGNRDRGDQHSWPSPSHTTRQAGPHRAVREVEVMRAGGRQGDRSRQWSGPC